MGFLEVEVVVAVAVEGVDHGKIPYMKQSNFQNKIDKINSIYLTYKIKLFALRKKQTGLLNQLENKINSKKIEAIRKNLEL